MKDFRNPVRGLLFALLAVLASPASAADEYDRVAEAANRFAANGHAVLITADRLQALLADADPANDPVLVSVCAPADYAKGHIKGAVSIPAAKVYQDGYLAMLPPTRRIVVADYNGLAAVGTSYVLSILGYNARGLQFGMMGWSKDDRLTGAHKRFPADQQRDFPIVTAR